MSRVEFLSVLCLSTGALVLAAYMREKIARTLGLPSRSARRAAPMPPGAGGILHVGKSVGRMILAVVFAMLFGAVFIAGRPIWGRSLVAVVALTMLVSTYRHTVVPLMKAGANTKQVIAFYSLIVLGYAGLGYALSCRAGALHPLSNW